MLAPCCAGLQYAAYMGIHGACTLFGCLLNNIWWHSKAAHTFVALTVMMVSIWNGACYQFHVFARKYQVRDCHG